MLLYASRTKCIVSAGLVNLRKLNEAVNWNFVAVPVGGDR